MPVILPTPDEIAAMPWHARARVRRMLVELLEASTPRTAVRPARWSAEHAAEVQKWAAQTREDAARRTAQLARPPEPTPDPEAPERFRLLARIAAGEDPDAEELAHRQAAAELQRHAQAVAS